MAPHIAILEPIDHRQRLGIDSTLDRVTICHGKNIQRPRVMRCNPGPPRFSPQQEYTRGAYSNDCVFSQQRGCQRPPESRRSDEDEGPAESNASVLPRDPGPRKEICKQARPASRWPVSVPSDAHFGYALRHRGCWQKSIPSAFAPNPCDPPAPPASNT